MLLKYSKSVHIWSSCFRLKCRTKLLCILPTSSGPSPAKRLSLRLCLRLSLRHCLRVRFAPHWSMKTPVTGNILAYGIPQHQPAEITVTFYQVASFSLILSTHSCLCSGLCYEAPTEAYCTPDFGNFPDGCKWLGYGCSNGNTHVTFRIRFSPITWSIFFRRRWLLSYHDGGRMRD